MGYVRRRDEKELARLETLYENPDYERIRAFAATRHEQKVTAGVLTGGSTLETLGGLTAVVCALIGLSSQPFYMAAVGTIAIGVALFAQGASIMARWQAAVGKAQGVRPDRHELLSGVSTEVFGGLVGIVLGILALGGVIPLVMLPVASIVFAASLLLGGNAQPDLVHLAPERNARYARITYDAIQTSGGVMVLVGVGAGVLGILALLDVGPILTLTLVALLAIGAALVFAGGALTARFVRRFT